MEIGIGLDGTRYGIDHGRLSLRLGLGSTLGCYFYVIGLLLLLLRSYYQEILKNDDKKFDFY